MIKSIAAQNFGCLKSVQTPQLQRLHAFIGPNDSGKSTLLRAANLAGLFATGGREQGKDDALRNEASELLGVREPTRDSSITVSTESGWYRISSKGTELFESVGAGSVSSAETEAGTGRATNRPSNFAHLPQLLEVGHVQLLRLNPDEIRRPAGLLIDNRREFAIGGRGFGLSSVLDAILNRGGDAFSKLSGDVSRLFSEVKSVQLRPINLSEKIVQVELEDGTLVTADRMSEGLLYYITFAAIRYMTDVSTILIEEPENGLHPSRIAEVIRSLRSTCTEQNVQIIMATHSPLVVNELYPEEVTLVTRLRGKGTRVTPIAETKNFAERTKIYSLGELWLSYANGTDESELVPS